MSLGAYAQSEQQIDFPSKGEISALVNKAAEDVVGYEAAIRAAKLNMDKADPRLFQRDMEAISAAREVVGAIQKNGASAYTLVTLLSVLDDIGLNASRDVFQTEAFYLQPDRIDTDHTELTAEMLVLSGEAKACSGISELILHTTLRYVDAEETILSTMLTQVKSSDKQLQR